MPRYSIRVKFNNKPQYAPKSFRDLPPMEPYGKISPPHNGIWYGSGVPIENVISYEYYYNKCLFCGNCNTEALCIHISHWEDLVGKDVIIETYCKKCGKFTMYHLVW